ncbi:hypothetical protein B0H66DRAFT_540687 [Apodospora peruviana]|uniref:Casein kinase II beta 2 subunit n=1 Tax=Apodospora peruviana TaxID=516989 RepID=A0AAE0IQS0_9PEZI|nr:hypothetical protein B0H66DRAFT_540687 [Apodospora peruviana]
MSPIAGGMWAIAALRVLSRNIAVTSKVLRSKLASAIRPLNAELQPVAVRNAGNSSRQPIHRAAFLRQQKRASQKWYSTGYVNNLNASVRRYLSNTAGRQSGGEASRFERSKLPVSITSRAVSQFTGRTPFASALRPNLTGGALPRTAGGYALPGGRAGGARYFSHTPAAPAQVVQNVSQAMRAFWLSGQRARFDGTGPNGERRYRTVNAAQEDARVRLAQVAHNAPGSFVDFAVSPTITALGHLGIAFPTVTSDEGFGAVGLGFKQPESAATLNAEGFLDILSVDFARALKDLTAIMRDLNTLAALGDLPITLEKNSVLRVRFPGVDAETVERLCDDIGVMRGIVKQDPDFNSSVGVPMALRFPFAPDGQDCAKTLTSPGGSLRSHDSGLSSPDEFFYSADDPAIMDEYENPWLWSPNPEDGYEGMSPPLPVVGSNSGEHCSEEDFDGLEGIYRFLEECDRARTRF